MQAIAAIYYAISGGYALLIIGIMLSGAWLAWRHRRQPGLRIKLIAGFALLLGPPAVFGLRVLNADQAVFGRRAEIARLERHPLEAGYPRRLEVDAEIREPTMAALVVLGYVDEARKRDYKRVRVMTAANSDAECIAAARDWLTFDAKHRRRPGSVGKVNDCVTVQDVEDDGPDTADAIVFRSGMRAKNYRGGDVFWNSIAEIMVRRDRIEQLVDYRENPHQKRPNSILSPFSWGRKSGPDLNPDEILFRAIADAQVSMQSSPAAR